jgi:hypothetical protein
MRNNSVYPDDITEEQTTGTRKNAPLFELALVLVRLDHIASVIVNANERNFADKSTSRHIIASLEWDMATHSQSDLQFEIGSEPNK